MLYESDKAADMQQNIQSASPNKSQNPKAANKKQPITEQERLHEKKKQKLAEKEKILMLKYS